MQKQIECTLIYYNTFKPLHEMSYESPDSLKSMFKDIFKNYILRMEMDINTRYEVPDENGKNCIEEILVALDRLTAFYVGRLWGQKAVEQDFKEESGLSEEVR